MKVCFVTEMGFRGKIPATHENMRTEFAWMNALDADHRCIDSLETIAGFDHVFVIFPKGRVNLNAVGLKISNEPNPYSNLLASDWLDKLKQQNKKVYFVQEGPHWIYSELEVADQIHFYNMLTSVDAIFAHNVSDADYYKGLVPGKPVHVLPTLMIETLINDINPITQEKAIIGGNFARWYGGFESYIVARDFRVPIWGQTSHAVRDHEDQLIQHLPRIQWHDWMKQLSSFKYAVHLMPTVAAGTFNLNCSYFGIPCIGNKHVDAQRNCQPELSVDVYDVNSARRLARRLVEDRDFYNHCSKEAKRRYAEKYSLDVWQSNITQILKD